MKYSVNESEQMKYLVNESAQMKYSVNEIFWASLFFHAINDDKPVFSSFMTLRIATNKSLSLGF
jgi:hypothetical protein